MDKGGSVFYYTHSHSSRYPYSPEQHSEFVSLCSTLPSYHERHPTNIEHDRESMKRLQNEEAEHYTAEIREGGQSIFGESGYRARLSVLGPGASKFRLISTHIHNDKCPPRSGIFQVSARRDPSHLDVVINCMLAVKACHI